jgi:hypothetical protein
MQLDGLRIVATGKPTWVPIEVACEQSKILLLIPKISFKVALIFSAGYRPSAKYVFKSLCTQDKKGMLRTF